MRPQSSPVLIWESSERDCCRHIKVTTRSATFALWCLLPKITMSFGSVSTSKVDYALPSPPSDGVSDLTFSPNGTLITAGSWDNGVRSHEMFLSHQSDDNEVKFTSNHLA